MESAGYFLNFMLCDIILNKTFLDSYKLLVSGVVFFSICRFVVRVIKIKIEFFVEYISKTRTVNRKAFLVCYKSLTKTDLCQMNLLD